MFDEETDSVVILEEPDRLGSLLSGITSDDASRGLIGDRLKRVLAEFGNVAGKSKSQAVAQGIKSVAGEKIPDFVRKENQAILSGNLGFSGIH